MGGICKKREGAARRRGRVGGGRAGEEGLGDVEEVVVLAAEGDEEVGVDQGLHRGQAGDADALHVRGAVSLGRLVQVAAAGFGQEHAFGVARRHQRHEQADVRGHPVAEVGDFADGRRGQRLARPADLGVALEGTADAVGKGFEFVGLPDAAPGERGEFFGEIPVAVEGAADVFADFLLGRVEVLFAEVHGVDVGRVGFAVRGVEDPLEGVQHVEAGLAHRQDFAPGAAERDGGLVEDARVQEAGAPGLGALGVVHRDEPGDGAREEAEEGVEEDGGADVEERVDARDGEGVPGAHGGGVGGVRVRA